MRIARAARTTENSHARSRRTHAHKRVLYTYMHSTGVRRVPVSPRNLGHVFRNIAPRGNCPSVGRMSGWLDERAGGLAGCRRGRGDRRVYFAYAAAIFLGHRRLSGTTDAVRSSGPPLTIDRKRATALGNGRRPFHPLSAVYGARPRRRNVTNDNVVLVVIPPGETKRDVII